MASVDHAVADRHEHRPGVPALLKHLEAQVDSLVELRGRTELLLKREGALICRAEKVERRLAETEKLLDGSPEVRCTDLVSES